jgi:hypothetical protein
MVTGRKELPPSVVEFRKACFESIKRFEKREKGCQCLASANLKRKAMAAAAAGKSTLGIPKKVGAEFMAADKGGKLPEHVKKKSRAERWYGSKGA